MGIECPVCEADNPKSSIWCKECRATLPYYGKIQDYYKGRSDTFAPRIVGPRKKPFPLVKGMERPTKEWKDHAENRVRFQFRILHIYAWMLEKKIITIEDSVIWGGAPLQQCRAGGVNQAAHKVMTSLLFSPNGNTDWKYLYEAPLLDFTQKCSPKIKKRVVTVLAALHSAVSIIHAEYNEADNLVENEIRAMVLRYIDEIRGIFVANEYNKRTWPKLWKSFRSDYANLCYDLCKRENTDKKYITKLRAYGEVAERLPYEKLKDVKKVFKKIVNTSEEGSW